MKKQKPGKEVATEKETVNSTTYYQLGYEVMLS